MLLETHLDREGRLTQPSSGYAQLLRTYSAFHQVVEEAYFDAQSQPVQNRDTGAYSLLREYDQRGNIRLETLWGRDGRPMMGRGGYASVAMRYGSWDLPEHEAFLNEQGQRVALENGYAATALEYDFFVNVSQERYEDEQGQPTPNTMGIWRLARVSYADEPVLKERYWDSQDQPGASSLGVAGIDNEYGECWNLIRITFVDAQR